jgi:hypothetical protein
VAIFIPPLYSEAYQANAINATNEANELFLNLHKPQQENGLSNNIWLLFTLHPAQTCPKSHCHSWS